MICISLINKSFNECLEIVTQEQLVEIRIDKLKLSLEETGKLFRASATLVATCRKEELSDQDRHGHLAMAVFSGASYVDIDSQTDDSFREELIQLAISKNCRVIVSYHNFDSTPSYEELAEIADQCIQKGGNVAKIACMVRSEEDVIKLLSLYKLDIPIISIGMGEMGKITRVAAPYLGAEFTYASYEPGMEAAAGQISREDMKQIFDLLNN